MFNIDKTKVRKVASIVGLIVVVIIVGALILNFYDHRVSPQPLSVRNYGGAAGESFGLAYSEEAGSVASEGFVDNVKSAISAPMTATESSGAAYDSAAVAESEGELTEKKIIRDATLDLFVEKPEEAATQIGELGVKYGGFIQNSRVYNVSNGLKSGYVIIRVPVDKFSQAIEEIKALAKEVDSETINAKDETEQFVDLEAQMRNLKVEETQYLQVLAKAEKIDDILKVSRALSNVRGQIERLQGQLNYLSRQADMSTITANLTAYEDVKVFGLRWRPLYEVKKAFRSLLESLTNYVNFVIALVMFLPVLILWVATILLIVVVAWKILKWIYRRFFKKPEIKIS